MGRIIVTQLCDIASWRVKTIVGYKRDKTFLLPTQLPKKLSFHVKLDA